MPNKVKATAPSERSAVDIELPLRRRSWFQSSEMATGLVAIALTGVFGFVSVELNKGDPTAWQIAAPASGYYWAVARYQVEFMRLRLELNSTASSSTAFTGGLRQRSKELATRVANLRASAGESASVSENQAFREAVGKMIAFQARIEEALTKPDFGTRDALLMLIELESMDSTVTSLANRVADEERSRREETLAGLKARRTLLWTIMAGTWCLTLAWLTSVMLGARKQRRANRARLKALEAERKAVLEKEDAVQAKSQFLTSISHELRSAVQSIRSALDLLQQEPEQKNRILIGRIQRATDALVTQLRDLLTIARGEAGKLEMHPAPFEARDLVQDVAQEYREIAQARGLKFAVSVPNHPVHVVADYTRIAQVLDNLVSNAVKYTRKGDVQVTLSEYDEVGQRLTVSVRDTGPGIPSQLIGRIFEQYQRLGNVDRTTDSAGIGLSVVKALASILGATVSVESHLGRGSEFVVAIPAMPHRPEESTTSEEGAMRLLIVDDRREILEGLAEVARSLSGVTVDTAASAALAANWMAAKKFDLVLIDLDMPGKNGLALASETRSGAGPNNSARLVAISAAEGRDVGSGWPFNEFAQKPIDRRVLQRLVDAGRSKGDLHPIAA